MAARAANTDSELKGKKRRLVLKICAFFLICDASAIDGMKQGAFDYLMKPVEMDQIITQVKEAAEKKRQYEEKINQAHLK